MLAERLPAMWGRATLATLVSSTSMKVASITVMAMIHGLMALRGIGTPPAARKKSALFKGRYGRNWVRLVKPLAGTASEGGGRRAGRIELPHHI